LPLATKFIKPTLRAAMHALGWRFRASRVTDDIYVFGNGIRVYRDMLLPLQVARYNAPGNPNLHEPVEESWISDLLRSAPEHCVFLDIGSGIGYYSILAKQLKPSARVFAVDPLPRHIEACSRNLTLNGIGTNEITAIRCAVAWGSGQIRFVDGGYGSRIATQGDPAALPVLAVNAITLDVLVNHVGGHVHVAKMDIQGAELNVIRAAEKLFSERKIETLVVGTHGPQLHRELSGLIRKHGTILHDDPTPEHQPDGIIVATFN